MRNKTFKIGLSLVIGMVCIGGISLAVFGFVFDLATSPIAISIFNAYGKWLDLQVDIENAFPAEAVIIRYDNHRRLNVTIINSAVNQFTVEEQKAQAAEVARLAWKNNSGNSMVRYIRITFVEQTKFLGIPFCRGNSFSFRKADLFQE